MVISHVGIRCGPRHTGWESSTQIYYVKWFMVRNSRQLTSAIISDD